MIAPYTEYNEKERFIEFSIDIYFNGESVAPLKCTRSNYLVDCNVLEEACTDSDTFIGSPSSNELSFRLLGSSGLFNPANSEGEYYGKIVIGLRVAVFCRPIAEEPYEWQPLGVYYVAEWQTDITGVTADVTAYDSLYTLLTDNTTSLKVLKDCSYNDICVAFFNANNKTAVIRGDLSEVLSYAFIDESNSKFLANFSIGALSYIYCDHNGVINVLDIENNGPVDYTITDSDQIITISSKQSIVLSYNGTSLTYYKMQLSELKSVLVNKAQHAPYGITAFNSQSFSEVPLYAIGLSKIASSVSCSLSSIECNATEASYEVSCNSSNGGDFDITLFGYVVESVPIVLSDNNDGMLSISNKYVQNEEYATHLKALLQRYLSLNVPVLELEVRGNPAMPIGSKLRVYSEFYNVDFTGILIRQNFKYDGGLSATMTILNSDIFGGA